MAEAVYVLCALTSFVCALLLLRSWRATGTRLLLWSGSCFCGLALHNGLLFFDLVVVPSIDLATLRATVGLLSLSLLVYGLVVEAR
jgi:hypothetical protein